MSNQVYSNITDKRVDQTLVLFDHDGTTCLTNENAYDSIKFGLLEAAKQLDLDPAPLEDKWDKFFSSTTGTTELYGCKVTLDIIGNYTTSLEEFARLHFLGRANWYKNMKSYSTYIYDTYYPDAESLIYYCWKTPNIHIGLVTGNPSATIKERLATHLGEIFFKPNNINSFGDEALSREELIKLSIEKATKNIPNFEPKIENNCITNVIYIGDSKADLYAGLSARVKTIWVPSRSLQAAKAAMSDDTMVLLKKLIPDNILITNNLENQEVTDFIAKK